MIHTIKGWIVDTIESDYILIAGNRAGDQPFNILGHKCFIHNRIIRHNIIQIPDDHAFSFLESGRPCSQCFRWDIVQHIYLGRNATGAPFKGIIKVAMFIFLENIYPVAVEHLSQILQ